MMNSTILLIVLSTLAITARAVELTVPSHHSDTMPSLRESIDDRLTIPSHHSDTTPSLRESQLDDYKGTYTNIRLPKDLQPTQYNVWLKPDLNSKFDFDGLVDIYFKCVKATKRVILHSDKLNITDFSLYKSLHTGLRPIKAAGKFKNETNSHIIFETDDFLQANGTEYMVRVVFNGMLATDNLGFYKQSYKTKSGQTRYFAAGLLGLRNARKAFPCFDEPEFKAEFQLFITHDKGLQAVSNMPIQRRIVNYKDDHLVDSEFKPTPKMSTYLLQFLVSDFSSFEEKTKCATKIGVWAVENNVNYTCLASSVTKRTLSFFERYTGIQYPLPKLDIAFIPNYYAIAFEGWGFIGFRPKDVLHNEAMDTPAEYFERTDNVAHSVAHMWLGDLVTIKWWNDIWLYQGCTVFLKYLVLDDIHKNWKAMDLFVYDSMTSLLRLDLPAKNTSTKPTRSPIIRPDKIDLGIIPFRKGACIYRMVYQLLGPKKFQQGIQTFLWRHRYGNVDADDLWKAFESVGGINFDIKAVMDGWLDQKGYPLVEIRRQGRSGQIILANQTRFTGDVKSANHFAETKGPLWHVPLYYTTSDSPNERVLLWMNKSSERFPIKSNFTWIKANAGQMNLYRVNYDDENWNNLIKQLNKDHTVFSSDDRYGLIYDSFTLASLKFLDLAIALNTTAYLRKEMSFAPFQIGIIDQLLPISNKILLTPSYDKFKKYMISLVKPMLGYLGWDDTGGIQERLLRVTAVKVLGYHGEKGAVDTSLNKLRAWMQNGTTIGTHIREHVCLTAILHGGEDEWEFLWCKYNDNTIDPKDKTRILRALAAAPTPKLRLRLFNYTFDESKIKKREILKTFAEVSKHRDGRLHAWSFFKTNFEKLAERIGNITGSYLGLAEDFNEEMQLREVEQLVGEHEILRSVETNKTLTTIRKNIQWMGDNAQIITDFLTDQTATMP